MVFSVFLRNTVVVCVCLCDVWVGFSCCLIGWVSFIEALYELKYSSSCL